MLAQKWAKVWNEVKYCKVNAAETTGSSTKFILPSNPRNVSLQKIFSKMDKKQVTHRCNDRTELLQTINTLAI